MRRGIPTHNYFTTGNNNCKKKLTMLLHNRQELDNDFRRWTNQDLTLATSFSIVDAV